LRASSQGWKFLIIALAIIELGLWFSGLPRELELARSGEYASLGVESSHPMPKLGSCAEIVDELNSESPLASAGVVPGDTITIVGNVGSFACEKSRLHLGDELSVEVERAGALRLFHVRPIKKIGRLDYRFNNVINYALALFEMGLGLLIGLRMSTGLACRALALAFLARGLGSIESSDALLDAFSSAVGLSGELVATFVFAIYYPDDRPSGFRRYFKSYVFPIYVAAFAGWGLLIVPDQLGRWVPYTSITAPLFFVGTALIILALFDGRRQSSGTLRQRYNWLLTAIALMHIFMFLAPLDWRIGGWSAFAVFGPTASLIAMLLLAYSTVRHRVLDFNFAINRAAVYTLTTALLLVMFGLAEWSIDHFLSFAGREKNMLVDAALALGIFLAFHRLRDFVDAWVERILFREWHSRDAALRAFVRRAAHATAAPPLLDCYLEAITAFSNGAPYALYQSADNATYNLLRSTFLDAPPGIGENNSAILALRESNKPLLSDELIIFPGAEVILPMAQRGMLTGLLVLGQKPRQGIFRPDEIELMAFATHNIGVDIHALKMGTLQADVESMRLKIEALQSVLHTVVTSSAKSPTRPDNAG
jgi:hypothetical protein